MAKTPEKPFLTDVTTLRRRAREHIMQGAVTPGYTADRETVLKLSRAGQLYIVRSTGPSVKIGREKDNDVVVDSQFASRLHARVFAREGHFVIQDQSSNGTYLLADGNSAEILLRREEAVLGERGWIGLGNSATRHGDHALRYRVEPEWD